MEIFGCPALIGIKDKSQDYITGLHKSFRTIQNSNERILDLTAADFCIGYLT
jgi:hypothetical protein